MAQARCNPIKRINREIKPPTGELLNWRNGEMVATIRTLVTNCAAVTLGWTAGGFGTLCFLDVIPCFTPTKRSTGIRLVLIAN
jgi:hypothetical protein